MEQLTFWNREKFKINKPIRLIELFAGIGSQAKALEDLGANFEHWKVCEFDKYAIASYNAVHGTNFEPSDITLLKGKDLEIVDTEHFTYLLTYLLLPLSRFVQRRKTTWNGQRQRNKKRTSVGSGKTSARDGKSSASVVDGECATSTRTEESA